MYKVLSASLTYAASSVRQVGKALSSAVVFIAAARRNVSRTFAAGIDFVGNLAYGIAFLKALSTTITFASTITHRVGKTLNSNISLAPAITRQVGKLLNGSILYASTVRRHISRSFATGIDFSANVVRSWVTNKLLSAGIDFLSTVRRRTGKRIVATMTFSGDLLRSVGKMIDATILFSGSIQRAISRSFTATIQFTGVARRSITQALNVSYTLAGVVLRMPSKALSVGYALGSTLQRRIGKNLQATVSFVGAVSRFLYDIAYVMNKTIRQIFAKVQITYSDPFFSAGVESEADSVGQYTYTEQTTDNVYDTAYKWFSLHENVLDGSYHPLPGDKSISVGWWGTQLSDSVTGAFSPPYPLLTITHAPRALTSLLVMGDNKLDEYPVDFEINLYDESDNLLHTESVTGNGSVDWTTSISVNDVAKQTLEITKWSEPEAVSKIIQFFTTLEEVYYSEDGDLVSVRMLEQKEYTSGSIPEGNIASSELIVQLNNIDDRFSAGNIDSALDQYLLNNRAIKAWLGVDIYPSGVRRWYPLGVFYTRDWSAPRNAIYAEVQARDMLDRLRLTTFSTSEVYVDTTLGDLAETVLIDAGLTSDDWDIDAALYSLSIPYAAFDPISHREALRRIAAGALGQVYCDRDGKIVITVYASPPESGFEYDLSNVFLVDHPLQWSQMVNYVEAQSAPLTPADEDDILVDVETITVPAGDTVTKTHFFFVSPCIDVQAPVIVTDPDPSDITVDSWTAYSWGVMVTYANAGAADQDITSVTVRGKVLETKSGRVAVAQDATSISQNGKQTLPEPLRSQFWQTEERAQAVADLILAAYKNPWRNVIMRARGNIAQLLGDRVTAPAFAGDPYASGEYSIMKQDINYDGGLEIMLTGQNIAGTPIRYSKSLAAGISYNGAVSYQQYWSQLIAGSYKLSATITRQIRRGLNAAYKLSGDVGYSYGKYDLVQTSRLFKRDGNYTTAHNASSADSVLSGLYLSHYYCASGVCSPIGYYFGRQPLLFNTDIPAGLTVYKAVLHLYCTRLYKRTTTITLQNGQPTYPHNPIVVGDYDCSKYSGDGGSLTENMGESNWYELELNSTGRSWIQTGGTMTKLMLRLQDDIDSNTPTNSYDHWIFANADGHTGIWLEVWAG